MKSEFSVFKTEQTDGNCPGGTLGNSPAFQRRVPVENYISPEGTTEEELRHVSARQNCSRIELLTRNADLQVCCISRFPNHLWTTLPLPAGEGRGEGESFDRECHAVHEKMRVTETFQRPFRAATKLSRFNASTLSPGRSLAKAGQRFNAFLLILAFAVNLSAQSPLTISIDTSHPGAAISPDFTGLSFELTQLLPGPDGVRYFRPDNTRLINLFQTLGIKNLRVGGNTSDRNWRRPPDQADIDSLFAFAKAADVKVLYCLRLHDGDPEYDAHVAKYIMDHYPDQIACFSIGQEPTAYPRTTNWVDGVPKKGPRLAFSTYSEEWKKFAAAVIKAAPNVKFCGPSTDDNPEWPREFLDTFGQGNHVTMITSHLYPGRSGDKVPSPEIGRDEMLSDTFVAAYEKLYNGFGPSALADGLSFRLEEVNNFFNGGASDVSDTFASSLWGLDFMYWWASHGADGLNFHTGDKVGAGTELRPSRYTAYFSAPDGFTVRPLGYGIKAFDLGRRGRFLSPAISNPDKLNASVYTVLGDDKNIYVTIINKEHGAQARAASVSVTAGAELADPHMMTLTAPGGDLAAKTGVTLGGARINSDGSWNGTWITLPPAKSGILNVTVPAGSATIIKLSN